LIDQAVNGECAYLGGCEIERPRATKRTLWPREPLIRLGSVALKELQRASEHT
jgi:hypothetical protein